LLLVLTAGLGKDGGNTLVGQILDETPRFLALGAHDDEGSQCCAGVHQGARAPRSTERSTNCCEPLPPV
jgi:hypothetical protein